ncbi:MAG: alkaline phosphatase family protein, partial [Acidimicrobiales bacterium]
MSHVVVIDLDNTHLTDMEQMPAVRDFFGKGTLFSNDHTGLIAYTHPDYVTAETGLYPSRTGIVSQFQLDQGQGVSFSYWPDRTPTGLPVHLSPAPWSYWNRQGDSVGAIGFADMELESTSEVPEYHVKVSPGEPDSAYLGYALHEANGSTVFGTPNLPYVHDAPLLLDQSQTVGDFSGGFDANFGPDRSLTAAAAMLTHGVDVVYDYIRTVHNSGTTGDSLAPDTAEYRANLAHYDAAFAAFFADLSSHGITPANTLFLLTSDEGDHYNPGGELTTGLSGQLSQLGFPTTGVQMVANSATMLYWPEGTQEPVGKLAGLPGWRYLAGRTVLRAIHAEPANRAYDPQLVIFAEPSWYYGSGSSTAITTDPYYWNHGTVARDVNSLWVGLAGPGVPSAQESREWVDATDLLPTLQRLVTGTVQPGLQGLAMVDALGTGPGHGGQGGPGGHGARSRDSLRSLTELYKQLYAPVGAFSRAALQVGTTAAIEPQLTDSLDSQLAQLTARRQAVAAQLHTLLREADSGRPLDPGGARRLAAQA